jgi:prevent-host-death family protein
MEIVTVHTAKSTLSQLLARVEAGEEIILARGREPIARLVPFQAKAAKRKFGALAGVINVGAEFFEPLSEQELAGWE